MAAQAMDVDVVEVWFANLRLMPYGTQKMLSDVVTNTPEWLGARKICFTTASAVGGLCGEGTNGATGPIRWVQYKCDPRWADDPAFAGNAATRQGHRMEPVIRRIHCRYLRLATGVDYLEIPEDGFWVMRAAGFDKPFGATPDGVVAELPRGTADAERGKLGAEYKAPFYKLYDPDEPALHGLKREHLCQVMFQMGVSGSLHADYVAICFKTMRATAVRVDYSPEVFDWIAECLGMAQEWLKRPAEEILARNIDLSRYRMPPMPSPAKHVRVRPLSEVYPHVPSLQDTLPTRNECERWADEADEEAFLAGVDAIVEKAHMELPGGQ